MQAQLCYTGVTMPQDEQNEPVYLTTKEAAERLGVTQQRVYALIRAKKLKQASRFGDRMWMIPREDVERLRAERIEKGIQEPDST